MEKTMLRNWNTAFIIPIGVRMRRPPLIRPYARALQKQNARTTFIIKTTFIPLVGVSAEKITAGRIREKRGKNADQWVLLTERPTNRAARLRNVHSTWLRKNSRVFSISKLANGRAAPRDSYAHYNWISLFIFSSGFFMFNFIRMWYGVCFVNIEY